jgi:hypothetical protein
MSKHKSKTATIREIESVVNRLLEDHNATYEDWQKHRFQKNSLKMSHSAASTDARRRAVKAAYA